MTYDQETDRAYSAHLLV